MPREGLGAGTALLSLTMAEKAGGVGASVKDPLWAHCHLQSLGCCLSHSLRVCVIPATPIGRILLREKDFACFPRLRGR